MNKTAIVQSILFVKGQEITVELSQLTVTGACLDVGKIVCVLLVLLLLTTSPRQSRAALSLPGWTTAMHC